MNVTIVSSYDFAQGIKTLYENLFSPKLMGDLLLILGKAQIFLLIFY